MRDRRVPVLLVATLLVELSGPSTARAATEMPAVKEEASSPAPPTGYEALAWGASLADVQTGYPEAQCEQRRDDLSDWMCELPTATVGSVPTVVNLHGYTNGRALGLAGYTLSFRREHLDDVVAVLTTRHGPPTHLSDKVFDLLGKSYPLKQVVWEFDAVRVALLDKKEPFAFGLVRTRPAIAESRTRTTDPIVRQILRDLGLMPASP